MSIENFVLSGKDKMSLNNEDSRKLSGVIEFLCESSSRINEAKVQRYWYPLAMATYGVEEIIEALDSLCSFRTSMWEKTRKFEQQFSAYQGCTDSIMVNSGSSADLLLSFLLVDRQKPLLKRSDEILLPIVTWPTQIWSVIMAGLSVRLVDVNPETLNIDLDDMERRITPRTKAIFLVHLLGNPCQMDRVMDIADKHGLLVLEDCCEALGAEWNGSKVGSFGVGGTFSFFFSHHMVTMEGGMVVCHDCEVADQLRILRGHGWLRDVENTSHYNVSNYDDIDPRYAFVNWGCNLRPTELQAGFGLHQLQKLPSFNARREMLASKFFHFIDQTSFLLRPLVHPSAHPSWLALPVMVRADAPFQKKQLVDYLEKNGVETRPIVAGNLSRHPVAHLFGEMFEGAYPGGDIVHDKAFYLGLSPMVADADMDRLLECMQQFLKNF
ncbi:MAG TPA: DegT/DnrJ/EryC1/StrS family aminotransferase [Gammaproteobacteria bacterium]|nr:DegT/DnrJ/EryC1/StrS family aminotransferase [Gammaproteobacteria bacterium]